MLNACTFLQHDPAETDEDNAWKPLQHFYNPDEDRDHAAGNSPVTATVLTWNVWFSTDARDTRHKALIDTVVDSALAVDIACFQEVEDNFQDTLRGHPVIQSDWLISDWPHSHCWYVTMMIVRKTWLATYGAGQPVALRCGVHMYEKSSLGRELLFAQFVATPDRTFTIVTTHLESHPNHREYRAEQMRDALACFEAESPAGTPMVWCGDTNIIVHSELAPLLNSGFTDTILHKHEDAFDQGEQRPESLFRALPTYGTTFPKDMIGDRLPRRLDYVLSRHTRILSAGRTGDIPIADLSGQGKDGKLYPSDHLGVYARLQWS